MREIKFRAWDKESAVWLDEDYFVILSNGSVLEVERYGIQMDVIEENNNVVLEQYTGLKDKNGVEIYENDIIEISDTSYGDSQNHYGVVKYSEYAELVVGNILLSRIYNAIEVIGNIHTDEKLLEQDE